MLLSSEGEIAFRVLITTNSDEQVTSIIRISVDSENMHGSESFMTYNEDGSLNSVSVKRTLANGGIFQQFTTQSMVSDGKPNAFSQDPALYLFSIIDGIPFNFGTQNIVDVTFESSEEQRTRTITYDEDNRVVKYVEQSTTNDNDKTFTMYYK
jgi:hypothetical protein